MSTYSDNSTSVEDLNEKEYIENKSIILIINKILLQLIKQNESKKNFDSILKKQKNDIFSSENIPNISILDYLIRIQKYSKIEENTLICSLIYLDKFSLSKKITITKYNIHKILFLSIFSSLKWNEDLKHKLDYYCKISGIQKKDFFELEEEFAKIIEFKYYINENVFNKYKNYLIKSIKL
jgi:hypothetical protein